MPEFGRYVPRGEMLVEKIAGYASVSAKTLLNRPALSASGDIYVHAKVVYTDTPACKYGLASPMADSLLGSAAKTVIRNITNEGNMYDEDPASYAYVNAAGTGLYVKWDFGSVAERFVYVHMDGNATYPHSVQTSNDGTNWTTLFSTAAAGFEDVAKASFRYIGLACDNYGITFKVYSFAVFAAGKIAGLLNAPCYISKAVSAPSGSAPVPRIIVLL